MPEDQRKRATGAIHVEEEEAAAAAKGRQAAVANIICYLLGFRKIKINGESGEKGMVVERIEWSN